MNSFYKKYTSLGSTLFVLFTISADANTELDSYGGWKDIQGTSTGWFHLETIHGRDLLITPEGFGFLSLGVNHLSAIKDPGKNEADLFSERHSQDWNRMADEVFRQYANWGFNTVDGSVEPLRNKLPYFAAATFARTAKYFSQPGGNNPYHFPDVFDPAVKESLETEVEAFCSKHRDNKNLIAYYWTDTPTWDIQKTRTFRGTDWVSEIRKLPSDSPGRRRYAVFLQNRYGHDLKKLNRAYELDIESFGELTSIDLDNLDLNRYEIAGDDEAFLEIIAKAYYGILGPAMQRHDPNHMVFGEKYLLGDIPTQVLKAAEPYIDAIAVQPGDGYIPIYTPGDTYPRREMEKLQSLTGLPIMICDHQISFATPRYPKSIWPYYQRANEADAALATELFLRDAFSQRYIIGYMRCQYIDRFSERRNASKLGLLRDDGTHYGRLLEAHQKAYKHSKEQVRQAVLKR